MFFVRYRVIGFVVALISCVGQEASAQLSCSAPRTWEAYRAPPQKWKKKTARSLKGRQEGFLAGMRLGGSSLVGALSVASKQQGLVPLETPNVAFDPSYKIDVAGMFGYREWVGSFLLGVECFLGWSSLSGEIARDVLPTATYHTLIKQQGFMDAGVVLAYPWRQIAPMMRLGLVLGRFLQSSWSERVMSQASSISILPGLVSEFGVETSWRRLGFRLSYTFKMFGRLESESKDFLYAPYMTVTQKAFGLKQHTVALSTFVQF